jgi:hypothetical protein
MPMPQPEPKPVPPPRDCPPDEDDDDGRRRLVDVGPGAVHPTSFESLYGRYKDQYDKFVIVEQDTETLLALQARMMLRPDYDPRKFNEFFNHFQTVPNNYTDFLFSAAPNKELAILLAQRLDVVTKPGAQIHLLIDGDTAMDLPWLKGDLESQGLRIIEHPGDHSAAQNSRGLQFRSSNIGGRSGPWYEALR